MRHLYGDMRAAWEVGYRNYIPSGKDKLKLNVGCALNKEIGPDWHNLDANPKVGPDILHDLNKTPFPIEDCKYHFILAAHVLEHVRKQSLFHIFTEFHRILVPGGRLICVTPYGSSNDSWNNPHHYQLFDEGTWAYFMEDLYKVRETSGFGADQGENFGRWTCEELTLVPYPEFQQERPWWKFWEPNLEYKRKHFRNIIQEVHCVLRAI